MPSYRVDGRAERLAVGDLLRVQRANTSIRSALTI